MKSSFPVFLSFFLLLSFSATDAVRLPFQKRSDKGGSFNPSFKSFKSFKSLVLSGQATDSHPLLNVDERRYVTNITINGIEVPVLLDTGSSDLWVIPPDGIGKFDDTRIQLDLFFGDGIITEVSGTIGVSPLEFGSYSIEKQAFLNAVQSNISDVQELGIFGLIGLGLDFATTSLIEDKVQQVDGPNAIWGQTVLTNIFRQTTAQQAKIIAIDLSRTSDLEDTDGGSFTIGEVLSKFESVLEQPKLSQHPTGGDRWTTLLEGVFVDGKSVDVVSTISGVPSGQSQTLLDTGNEIGNFPTVMLDAIYTSIPGSALNDGPGSSRFWVIPCNTTTNVEVVFGGQHYPIHPLDLSIITKIFTIDGQPHVACTSSFLAADGSGSIGFDISLGDAFLRNVYSVFDLGDIAPDGSTQNPFMQLLSKTNPAQAATEVSSIRGKTMANLPPEIDPHTFVAKYSSIVVGSPSTSAGPAYPTSSTSPASPGGITSATNSVVSLLNNYELILLLSCSVPISSLVSSWLF